VAVTWSRSKGGLEAGLPDITVRPDLATLATLPWEPNAAWCLGDASTPDGNPAPESPRAVVQGVASALATLGYSLVCGPELEFFLCEQDAGGSWRRYANEPGDDGARHWALRRLLQRDFTMRALAGYEIFLPALTATTLDAAFAASEFDFVKAVSADYPIRVLVRLLDIPDEFGGQLIKWSNRLVGKTGPEYADVLFDSAASAAYRDLPFHSPAALEVFAYGDELARQRRGGDGIDLVSKLVNTVPEDGLPLSERDFHNYFLLLIAAGNETTRHTISHAMLALQQHPQALARLQEEPTLVQVAVEEFLRWASPVYHFRRTARRDIELRGQQIQAGDEVVVWFASGNRDEEIFGNPDDLDITRQPNDHVTLGKAARISAWATSLARLELRIIFTELLRRLDTIELTGPPEYVRSNFIHGVKRLPVRASSR
jgi:cytochrome P450